MQVAISNKDLQTIKMKLTGHVEILNKQTKKLKFRYSEHLYQNFEFSLIFRANSNFQVRHVYDVKIR